jgi:hypothetical protein
LRLVSRKFWLLGSATIGLFAATIATAATKPVNEIRLGGLQPGRDTLQSFKRKVKREEPAFDGSTEHSYYEICNYQTIDVYPDSTGRLTRISVTQVTERIIADCTDKSYSRQARRWLGSGHDLLLGDTCQQAIEIYGKPASETSGAESNSVIKSMTYDFGWAGSKVPQAMQVECSIPENKVIKMTLYASKP